MNKEEMDKIDKLIEAINKRIYASKEWENLIEQRLKSLEIWKSEMKKIFDKE